ncbi:MAG TPA: hypothetical protein VGV61_16955 [Thermoanaerobaculia bacterium]|jgi:hypothetical protein|nr:hypothetical protein [Thermoanaerobaculia bacterium]
MRKMLSFVLISALLTTAAFAHGANKHQLLGTIKQLHENHLTVTDQHQADHTVELNSQTKLEKGGKPATRADLKGGTRVSIHLSEDGKVAEQIKIADGATHQQ